LALARDGTWSTALSFDPNHQKWNGIKLFEILDLAQKRPPRLLLLVLGQGNLQPSERTAYEVFHR
jgi:hypothetical protein